MKTIVQNVYNSDQSWYYEEIVNMGGIRPSDMGGKKLKIEIRKNAYVAQSYSTISVWSGCWNEVYSIPGELMASKMDYVDKNVTAKAFAADRTKLIEVATDVLEC